MRFRMRYPTHDYRWYFRGFESHIPLRLFSLRDYSVIDCGTVPHVRIYIYIFTPPHSSRSSFMSANLFQTMTCFKRAGADVILTYYAKDAARWLCEDGLV